METYLPINRTAVTSTGTNEDGFNQSGAVILVRTFVKSKRFILYQRVNLLISQQTPPYWYWNHISGLTPGPFPQILYRVLERPENDSTGMQLKTRRTTLIEQYATSKTIFFYITLWNMINSSFSVFVNHLKCLNRSILIAVIVPFVLCSLVLYFLHFFHSFIFQISFRKATLHVLIFRWCSF